MVLWGLPGGEKFCSSNFVLSSMFIPRIASVTCFLWWYSRSFFFWREKYLYGVKEGVLEIFDIFLGLSFLRVLWLLVLLLFVLFSSCGILRVLSFADLKIRGHLTKVCSPFLFFYSFDSH